MSMIWLISVTTFRKMRHTSDVASTGLWGVERQNKTVDTAMSKLLNKNKVRDTFTDDC